MIQILPGKDKILLQAIRRGRVLRYHVRPVPQGNTAPLRTLRQIEAAGSIHLALKSSLRAWLASTDRAWRLEYCTADHDADIVLGYSPLTEAQDYTRAMTTGWTQTMQTAHIRIDTAAMRWSLDQSLLRPFRSLFGRWRIPLQPLILHECGHALGLGHTVARRTSVMYAAGYALAPQPDLHTRSGFLYPTERDKIEFRDYYDSLESIVSAEIFDDAGNQGRPTFSTDP